MANHKVAGHMRLRDVIGQAYQQGSNRLTGNLTGSASVLTQRDDHEQVRPLASRPDCPHIAHRRQQLKGGGPMSSELSRFVVSADCLGEGQPLR